ncbi:MAG: ribonucleoside triphosphate reductase [Planctomycetota bacterium]|nr:ribonucleoside triphosphate reductase [Planctomycetota bacterium]MCX8040394.1 ribonucleoside triphosphate reductase [Planctomycetota bacterium]MDW8372230.1 ribonucleoside triphosphate reductase [Planctomycetota bacterium]
MDSALPATIVKRDGRRAPFDAQRITNAIAKAGAATGEFGPEIAARLTRQVLAILGATRPAGDVGVEDIQDIVEDVLLASPYRATAKAYIIYRDQHARLRELTQQAQMDILDRYLARSDWTVSENANMAWSLQGLNNHVASEITRTYWLNRVYPREVRLAHQEGDLHLHDLNALSVYCVGWDLADLLESGFTGAPGKAESAPARHFRSALGQVVNFFYTLQGEAAGAQAFASLDTYLAPFIRHDGLSEREVEQALQEFVFNLNVATRVGFQTPFTNVTLDIDVPRHMAEEPVLIGGRRQPGTRYGDYQAEMDLFNRCFLRVLAQGDAKGRVFTFPIPTVNITKDFDFDDPRHRALWEATAKYGIPYFANFRSGELSPDDARSMCCRLRLDTRELKRRGGGLFGANPLTGSIGVVTINMPRLGHCSASEREFLERLGQVMDIAKTSLEIKRKTLERLTDARLYPYSAFYLRRIKARTGSWWHNHFSTIGLVGLHEAVLNLMGVGLDHPRGRAFGLTVLAFMRQRLADYQAETGHFYNLEATPAEGTSYRLARLDRERHPALRLADGRAIGEVPHPCYTNSSQLPVNYSDDIWAVLEHQDEFQCSYTGGTVVHVYLGEACVDPQAVAAFVRQVFTRYRLPYISITPTFSVCPVHGYRSGRHDHCPDCGAASEVYSRVVGYLRPIQQWNDGKRAEFEQRSQYRLEPALAGAGA